jgi:hypothetical protein
MTDREMAIELFRAYQKARLAHLFHGGAKVDPAAFGYRHGWVTFGSATVNARDVYGDYVTSDYG